MAFLEVTDLGLERHKVPIVQGLSFSLAAGAMLNVIGANGSGKSTLLKLLSGQWQANVGAIRVADRALAAWPRHELAACLACLPQASELRFPFAAEEVVLLGRLPHATSHATNARLCREVMTLLDITYLYGRLYPNLSGGEKQRVQLARVLLQLWGAADDSPRLLLLDEPSGALDIGHKQQLLAVLKQCCARGVGIVMVEHDLAMTAAAGGYLLALQCGRIAAYGPTREVLTRELLRALFQVDAEWVQAGSRCGVALCL